MKQLVVGLGQIGTAVQAVLECDGVDKELDINGIYDVLHICIPYESRKQFREGTMKAVNRYQPLYIVIHSTVKAGTSDYLSEYVDVVHSPVRGRHPNLEPGVRTFVKFFGGERADKAAELFKEKGIKTVCTPLAKTTEIMKLWDTTIYGLAILMQKRIKAACDASGVDFDIVYTQANKTYNDGYEALGEPQFKKFVINNQDGPVGGHCIQSNATILHESGVDYEELENLLALGQKVEENPQRDKTWLYCEYWGKKKSTIQIADELGLSDVAISAQMKKNNVPVRDKRWTKYEDRRLTELAKTKTFPEIAIKLNKSHSSIRSRAISLGIKSIYKPGENTKDIDVKKKISCTLRGIPEEDFDGFIESENSRERNSVRYHKWRTSVFERDDYRCINGCTESSYIQADHIEPWALNKDLRFEVDNGQTLCVKCHKKKTKSDIKKIKESRN